MCNTWLIPFFVRVWRPSSHSQPSSFFVRRPFWETQQTTKTRKNIKSKDERSQRVAVHWANCEPRRLCSQKREISGDGDSLQSTLYFRSYTMELIASFVFIQCEANTIRSNAHSHTGILFLLSVGLRFSLLIVCLFRDYLAPCIWRMRARDCERMKKFVQNGKITISASRKQNCESRTGTNIEYTLHTERV